MKKVLPPIIFAVLSVVLLLTFYSDMLYTAHWRTPFMGGALFRDGLLADPFGALSYAGCWLTQSLLHPVAGVAVLMVVWLASWWAGVKALGLRADWQVLMLLPMACLVLSLTDVGYWIYCMHGVGYWFAQSLGYLCCLSLLGLLGLLRRGWVARVVQVLASMAVYPVIGWYAYLLALCLGLRQRNWWCLLVVMAPGLWQQMAYPHVSMYAMWTAGSPVFVNNMVVSQRPMVPFYALVALTALLAVIPSAWRLGRRQWTVAMLATVALASVGVWQGSFKDYNYLAEMRMTRMAMVDDWRGVLAEAERSSHPSRTMVALKNVALLNTGQLGSRSYVLGNDGRDITNPDGINVNIMQIAAPVVYYNHGMTNYASRWCIENAVAYGYSPYYLQVMARCATASGEQAMVARTLRMLHTHWGYADWQPQPVSPAVRDLRSAFANVIDADNNSCEHYVIDIFSKAHGSDYPVVQELNLFYAMLHGAPGRFWPAMADYARAHQGADLPLHYQEAYCYFMQNYPAELPFAARVSGQTYERYQQFAQHLAQCRQSGADKATIGEAMRQRWGQTYWWHQCFGRSSY